MANMLHCMFCSKTFSSMSNRLKHERNFHREEEEEGEYDSENEEEELTDDEVEKESLASEPETVIRQREEEDGADSAWSFVVMEAVLAADFPKGLTVSDILENKELTNYVIKLMVRKIHDWKKTLAELEEDDDVYQKITATKDRLIEQEEYSDDEATIKSFSERKGLLKRILRSHQDIVEQALHTQNAAETDEEIEDENDNPTFLTGANQNN